MWKALLVIISPSFYAHRSKAFKPAGPLSYRVSNMYPNSSKPIIETFGERHSGAELTLILVLHKTLTYAVYPVRAAAMTLRTVLLSLQALLAAAEPDDPQDAVVANQVSLHVFYVLTIG